MWTFRQRSGLVEDFTGRPHGASYAGHGEGRNNPIMQDIHAGCRWRNGAWVSVDGLTPGEWGPLPVGLYEMQPPVDTPKHGPFVLWLTPHKLNEMFGRSGFGWHGDSIEHPGLASEGCICSPRPLRELAWNSGDRTIQVLAS